MAGTPQAAQPLRGADAGGRARADGAAPASSAPAGAAPERSLRERWAAYVDDVLHGSPDDFDRSTRVRTRRTWAWDVLTIGFVVVVAVFAAVEAGDGQSGPAWQFRLAVEATSVVVSCVLLLWRRQRPITIALLTTAVGCLAPSTGFAVIVAVFAAGAYGRPRAAKVAIAVALLTTPVSLLVWPRGGAEGSLWSDLMFGSLITLGVGAWGLYSGARRELLATLEERAERAESEQALRIDQARAAERTRIAREMHDVLAHRMSLLSVHAGALEFRSDAPPEEIARAAGVIRSTAHDALEELRAVIGVMRVGESLAGDELRSPGLGNAGSSAGAPLAPEPPQPTLTAVPQLVEEWRQAGAKIELELDLTAVETLPAAVGRTAYRLVQEALTNAGKHAPTAKVTVRVSGEPGESMVVTVTNPIGVGRPSSPIPGTGLGLVGLRERTELVGGVFAAGIDEDLRRFVLEARLPWPAA